MTDFTLIKTAAEHAIKARGTLLADAAQSNYDGLVTPESVLELACAHEQLKTAYTEFAEKTDWARTWNSPNELGQHIADVIKMRFEQLKAENEVLRKDAERYRWLREDEGGEDDLHVQFYESGPTVGGNQLDELVDAAMSKEAGE